MDLQVFQVRLKSTGRVYAMKVMRKDRVLERDHGDYIKAERDVLTAVLHPYIVALRYSFQVSMLEALPKIQLAAVCSCCCHQTYYPHSVSASECC